MGCYILVMISILVVNQEHTSKAQKIIEERVRSYCSLGSDQEVFQYKLKEVFRELYLTHFMDFEKKIINMLKKQEQDLQKLKELFTENQKNWQKNFSNFDRDVRDIMIRQSDLQTTILMIQNNITLLETKSSLLQDAFSDHNDTLSKVEGGQNEIRNSVLVMRNNVSQLEANSLSFDIGISEQNKTIERIWNSYNEIRNRVQYVVTKSYSHNSAIQLTTSNINRLSGSVALTKDKMLALEKSITSLTKIRLVNGTTWNEGRVEVFHNREWGTVCGENWTDKNAHVVCRQLGYFTGVPFPGAAFGEGEVKIWMGDVECEGSESNIFDCANRTIGTHNCSHHEDVGVACMKSFAMRLMNQNSISRHEGRVEILINGTWGTVCDDLWDTSDAKVVCRYLGYTGNAVAYSSARYGKGGSGVPIYLDDVACTGSESFILDCRHRGLGSHNCKHNEDAGVKCNMA